MDTDRLSEIKERIEAKYAEAGYIYTGVDENGDAIRPIPGWKLREQKAKFDAALSDLRTAVEALEAEQQRVEILEGIIRDNALDYSACTTYEAEIIDHIQCSEPWPLPAPPEEEKETPDEQ